MQRRMITVPAVLSLMMLFVGGCSNRPSGVAPDARMVGLADSGSLVRLNPEQELVLKLNSNPTTGYTWRIDKTIDQAVLLPDGNKFSQTSQQRARSEEVGTQLLRFIAQQPGRTTLKLVYTSLQQGIVEGTPTYELEIIVAPKPVPAQ